MIIREGTIEEVENFPMYNEGNEGQNITVAELNGEVIAFMQHDGANIYFLEAAKVGTGAGSALVEYLKGEYEELHAIYVQEECAGFWEKMGFEIEGRNGLAKNYVWYAE